MNPLGLKNPLEAGGGQKREGNRGRLNIGIVTVPVFMDTTVFLDCNLTELVFFPKCKAFPSSPAFGELDMGLMLSKVIMDLEGHNGPYPIPHPGP